METQRNATTRAVAVAMLLGAGLSAGREPADTLEVPGPSITLRMLNQADVDKRTLMKSEKEAAAILRRAGIELVWLACEAGRVDGRTANPCQRDRSAAEFWFTIVTHKPARTSSDMLGFTEFDEAIGMSTAGVHYPSALEAAKKCHADVFQILGAAIAHEVGHLILGANAHYPGGVMSPHWGPAQFERISISELSFSPDQAKLLQDEVRRRTSAP